MPIVARANARLADARLPAADRPLFAGTIAQWVEDLALVAELGIEHVFFAIDGPVEARLRAMAELRERAAQ